MPGRDGKKKSRKRRAPARPRQDASAPLEEGRAEPGPIAGVGDEPGDRPRTGQIASETARFDLGPHARVIGDALGLPPPGYGTTVVSLFVRDPSHVVAVWDVNDESSLARAEERGWEALELRVVTLDGAVLARVQVGERSGVYHVALEPNGVTVVAEIGFIPGAGEPDPVARSVPVRVPALPRDPSGVPVRVAVPPRFDRRALLRAEGPPRVGHRPLPSRVAPAARLVERIRLARRVPASPAPSEREEGGPETDGGPGPGTGAPPTHGGGTDAPAGGGAPSTTSGAPPGGGTAPARVPPRAAGEPPRSDSPRSARAVAGQGSSSAPGRRTDGAARPGSRPAAQASGPSGEGRKGGRGPSGEGRAS